MSTVPRRHLQALAKRVNVDVVELEEATGAEVRTLQPRSEPVKEFSYDDSVAGWLDLGGDLKSSQELHDGLDSLRKVLRDMLKRLPYPKQERRKIANELHALWVTIRELRETNFRLASRAYHQARTFDQLSPAAAYTITSFEQLRERILDKYIDLAQTVGEAHVAHERTHPDSRLRRRAAHKMIELHMKESTK